MEKEVEGVVHEDVSGQKRRRGDREREDGVLLEEQEGLPKVRRHGGSVHRNGMAIDSTPGTSDGGINDKLLNETAYVLRFSKHPHVSNRNKLIKYTMPCKEAPSPEGFMSTNRKLKVQVMDAWTIMILSKWFSDHFMWCALGEYPEGLTRRTSTHGKLPWISNLYDGKRFVRRMV